MKLQPIYSEVAKSVTTRISETVLIRHINIIIESGMYHNLVTRVAHDIKNSVFSAQEVCMWYDKYDCHDEHITTLFKRVIKNEYPMAWEILQTH